MANRIRKALYTDLAAMLAINNELVLDKWSEERFTEAFEHELEIYVLINNHNNHEIIGYLIGLICLDEVRILNLVISTPFRGVGAGYHLLYHVLVEVKNDHQVSYALLEVDVNNFTALKLYTRLGFRILCVRENYYTDQINRDAYLLQLRLG